MAAHQAPIPGILQARTLEWVAIAFSTFPMSQFFSSESVLHIRWPKYRRFSFSISPSNAYSGLISFRVDWLDLLSVQGTPKSLLQHHSSKASILYRRLAFFMEKAMATHSSTLAWRIPGMGAWWAAVYGVAQSQTRLKQLSSSSIKKAEHQRIDDFELWCCRRFLRVPWTTGRSNQSILKEIIPEYSLEGLMLKLQDFGQLM